jgi:hypothetical protein
MIGARFCINSDLEIRWASSDDEIVQHARAFVNQEGQQTVEQQLKDITHAIVNARLAPVQSAVEAARSAEVNRTSAADRFKTAYADIVPLLDKAIVQLCAVYIDDLAQVGAYGLQVKNGPRSLKVLKPNGQAEWIKFANRYVEIQGAISDQQRIKNPPFDHVLELIGFINEGLATRNTEQTARRTNVRARVTGAQELLELLQVAGITLIYTRFGGQISPELANWGYTVASKPVAAQAKPIEPPAPPAA